MHHCKTTLITCEDFRLHQRKDGRNFVAEFIKKLGEDCDLITRAGGVRDFVQPPELGFHRAVLRDLNVSLKLHGAEVICLMNHEDCGAYADFKFSSKEEEFKQHKKDLLVAKEFLSKNFPGKKIKIYFAKLVYGLSDEFKAEEIK